MDFEVFVPVLRKPLIQFVLSLWAMSGSISLWANTPFSSLRFTRIGSEDGSFQAPVQSIVQDKIGFLWVGTSEGLLRFDGYSFKRYSHKAQDPNSLSGNLLTQLTLDVQDRMWVGGSGLDLYDAVRDCFVRYMDKNDTNGLVGTIITATFVDRRGQLWIGSNRGLFLYRPAEDRFEPIELDQPIQAYAIEEAPQGQLWIGTTEGLIRYHQEWGRSIRYTQSPGGLPSNQVFALCPDGRGGLWIGTRLGLARYFHEQEQVVAFAPPPGTQAPITKTEILTLHRSGKGGLWIGTRSEGLGYLDPIRGQTLECAFDPHNPKTLPHNGILSLYEDRFGYLWVGTEAGLAKANQNSLFGAHDLLASDPLPGHDDIRAIEVTSDGIIWLGTYGQGLTRYDEDKHEFTHFRHDPQDPNSLPDNIVWMIGTDREKRFWVGTDTGLAQKTPTGFQRFLHDPDQPQSITANAVYAMLHDDVGRLWFTTSRGLNRYLGDSRFESHLPTPKGLSSSSTWCIAQGSRGRIWIGTGDGGLNDYDPERKVAITYNTDPNDPNSISSNQIYCIRPQPSKGNLWVGTHGGLNRMAMARPGYFEHFGEEEGLPNTTICGLLEDAEGQIWISSKRGLSCLNPATGEVRNFVQDDGLQGFAFNEGAIFAAPDRRLYFGGVQGYNAFWPTQIGRDGTAPATRLTAFLLENEEVLPQPENPQALLRAPLMTTKKLNLTHEHRMITFEFAGLHLAHPAQNRYAYYLEGHDRDWITTDARRRSATYTNLAPGRYQFRVKSANRDGLWGEETALTVEMGAPPWRSWWAFVGYGLLLLGVVGGYVRTMRRRLAQEHELAEQRRVAIEREQAAAEQERKTVSRLREIDRIKGEFLSNISHELRTPLNGIMGLAEVLRNQHLRELDGDARGHLDLILSSGKRLTFLINGLLDFGQLQRGSLLLNRRPVNLNQLVSQVIQELSPLANQRGVQLRNLIGRQLPEVAADEKRLMQILFNLGENGIKFTQVGSVSFSAEREGPLLRISVSDTGVGIAQEQLGEIFDSFRQVDGSAERIFSGSGLGLALTRQLVLLHGGEMFINSVLGEGTRVVITIPLVQEGEGPVPEVAPESQPVRPSILSQPSPTQVSWPEQAATPLPAARQTSTAAHILVVDDEPINRVILVNLLQGEGFKVTEAADGATVLELFKKNQDIDLILLDIMMPRMSGYEVCRSLREQFGVTELPILMLTARNQEDDLVRGFETGANDYLVKPFVRTELLSRVHTHLALLRANRDLEGLVFERTRELREKNESIVRWQQQLVMQERRVSLGVLTAGISHEINNPTTFVFSGTQNLQVDLNRLHQFLREIASDDASEILDEIDRRFQELEAHLEIVTKGASRIRSIVRDLHVFARVDEAESERVCLVDQLKSTVNLISAQFHHKVAFHFDFQDPLEMVCCPSELSQVFLNIISNACQSIEKRLATEGSTELGNVTIRTWAEGDYGLICFEDDGEGIPAGIQDHIFEPFFTTKNVGEGTGLGLSISNDLVKKHGGYIVVESTLGLGSKFRLVLPKTA